MPPEDVLGVNIMPPIAAVERVVIVELVPLVVADDVVRVGAAVERQPFGPASYKDAAGLPGGRVVEADPVVGEGVVVAVVQVYRALFTSCGVVLDCVVGQRIAAGREVDSPTPGIGAIAPDCVAGHRVAAAGRAEVDSAGVAAAGGVVANHDRAAGSDRHDVRAATQVPGSIGINDPAYVSLSPDGAGRAQRPATAHPHTSLTIALLIMLPPSCWLCRSVNTPCGSADMP